MRQLPVCKSVTAPAMDVLARVAEELSQQEVAASIAAVIAVMQRSSDPAALHLCCDSLLELGARALLDSLEAAREALGQAVELFSLDERLRASLKRFATWVVAAGGECDGFEGEESGDDEGERVEKGEGQSVPVGIWRRRQKERLSRGWRRLMPTTMTPSLRLRKNKGRETMREKGGRKRRGRKRRGTTAWRWRVVRREVKKRTGGAAGKPPSIEVGERRVTKWKRRRSR
eukprot:3007433-Rhodomonas_salina.1